MEKFEAKIQRFGSYGEKTGWTYIQISQKLAHKLKPNTKVSFRVKGFLDDYPISQSALIPMGEGQYILPIKSSIRKKIHKTTGDLLSVSIEYDNSEIIISPDLLKCLEAEPACLKFFDSLTKSHQRYFSKWIEEAKQLSTKTKRITMAMEGFSKKQSFSEMIRANKFR